MDELSGADPQSCSNNELELTNSLEEDKENLSHEGKFYSHNYSNNIIY